MSYLDQFKLDNPGIEKYTDDEILSVLPDIDPSLRDMSPEEVKAFATSSAPSGLGLINNSVRGAAERGGDLLGGVMRAGSAASDWLEEKLPAGGFVFDDGIIPSYKNAEEFKQAKEQDGWKEPLDVASQHWKNADAGYEEQHGWEDVKRQYGDTGLLSTSTIGEVFKYGFEQGIKSVPDMIGAVVNLPAYITARSGEIGEARAANKGKNQADIEDIAEAAPFAVGSALLERIGAKGIADAGIERIGKEALEAGFAKASQRIATEGGKAAGKESLTEFIQEGMIEYTGERFGTDAAMSFAEALDQGMAGAVAGGVYGGSIGAASAAQKEATRPGEAASRQKETAQAQGQPEAATVDPVQSNINDINQFKESLTAQEMGLSMPEPVDYSQYEQPSVNRASAPTDGLSEIEQAIRIAEKEGFADEAVRLRTAKSYFDKAELARQQGMESVAGEFSAKGNAIYQDVMDQPVPEQQARPEQFPQPYVSEGEVQGGELSIRPQQAESEPTADIEGQAQEIPQEQPPPGTNQINQGYERPERQFNPVDPLYDGVGRNVVERQAGNSEALPAANPVRSITPEQLQALQKVRGVALRTKIRERTPEQVEAIQIVEAVKAGELEVSSDRSDNTGNGVYRGNDGAPSDNAIGSNGDPEADLSSQANSAALPRLPRAPEASSNADSSVGAGRAGNDSSLDITLNTKGLPYASEKSAKASKTYRSNKETAKVIPVEGGFGIATPKAEQRTTSRPSDSDLSIVREGLSYAESKAQVSDLRANSQNTQFFVRPNKTTKGKFDIYTDSKTDEPESSDRRKAEKEYLDQFDERSKRDITSATYERAVNRASRNVEGFLSGSGNGPAIGVKYSFGSNPLSAFHDIERKIKKNNASQSEVESAIADMQNNKQHVFETLEAQNKTTLKHLSGVTDDRVPKAKLVDAAFKKMQQALKQPVNNQEEVIENSDITETESNGGASVFKPDSGTLSIPRSEMPQIKTEHRGAMVNFMNARGIKHDQLDVDPLTLKPTQADFIPEKVKAAKEHEGGDRSILISSDNHVLDGHHQWLAKREGGQSIKAIKLDAPIADLVPLANEFPSSENEQSSEGGQSNNSQTTVKQTKTDSPKENASSKFSRAQPKEPTIPLTKSANQFDANYLSNHLSRYFNDDRWKDSFTGYALPDSLGEFGKAVQAAFGKRIAAVMPTSREFDILDGIHIQGRETIFVNPSERVSFVGITGHELYHEIAKSRPDLHKWLTGKLADHVDEGNFEAYRERLDSLLQPGEPLHSNDVVQEELLADLMGDAFLDKPFLEALAKDNPTYFRRLVNAINIYLNKIKGRLKGLNSKRYFNDVSAMQKHLRSVLNAYADGVEISEVATPKTSNENVVELAKYREEKAAFFEWLREQKAGNFSRVDDDGPESPAWKAAKAKGLDMSEAARMERAEAMGFDTSKVWYHGTDHDFDQFDDSFLGKNTSATSAEKGIFLASSADVASYYPVYDYSEWGRLLLDAAKEVSDKADSAAEGKQDVIDAIAVMHELTTTISGYNKRLQKHQKAGNEKSAKRAEANIKDAEGELDKYIKNNAELITESAQLRKLIEEKNLFNAMLQRSISESSGSNSSGEFWHSKQDVENRDLTPMVIPLLTKLENTFTYDYAGESYRDSSYSDVIDKAKSEGYDSVLLRSTKDPFETDVLVVFNPENIRSINAAFDPGQSESPNLLFSRSAQEAEQEPQPVAETFAIPTDSLVASGIRKIADKFKVLKDLQANIKATGVEIDETADAYMAEELFHGKAENDLRQMRQTFVEPLAKKMADFGITQAELDKYLYAKHAAERNDHIAEINPDLQDGGSGMTNAEASEIISNVELSGKANQYEQVTAIVYDMLAAKRDQIRAAGLEDSDVVDAWEASYQHYVPLKGFAADETQDGLPRSGSGFTIGGRESRRALGRTSEAASPSSYAISDLTETLIRKRKNEVGNAFLNLVEANPNSDYWQVFTDENPETDRRIVKSKDPLTGETIETVKEMPLPMAMLQDRYFTTKRDGVTHYIKLEDPRLMKAMKNIGPDTSNFVIQGLAKANRWLSAVNTSYNPEFVVGNFARDIQTAALNLSAEQTRDDGKAKGEKIVKQTIKDVPKAMKAVYRSMRGKPAKNAEWANYFEEFQADGAKTGYFDMKDIDGQAKDVQRLIDISKGGFKGGFYKWTQAAGKLVEDTNNSVENAVRLSAYVNARKAGISRAKAASLAKNMTVNFNRRGEMGTTLNALYMFANASIQGSMNFARTMIGLNGEKGDPIWSRLNKAQKISIGIMAGSYAFAMANRMGAGEDDDGENWYDKVPQYVKERNLVIMKSLTGGEQDGKYWKIPLPYGYNIFHVIGTSMESVANDPSKTGQAATDLAFAALGSFSPIGFQDSHSATGIILKNVTPTLGKPIVDLAMNENFMGSSIYNENFPFGTPKPESSLSRRSTPEAYKAIAEFLNDQTGGSQWRSGSIDINPDKIRYIVDYALGGSGKFFISKSPDNAQYAYNLMLPDAHRTVFLSRVSGKVLPYEDQNKFYDRRDEINQIKEEYKALTGGEKLKFYRDNREKMALQGMVKGIEKQLKALRKQRDAVYALDLPLATRERRLDIVEGKMKRVVDRFNKAYSAAN